ncbi:hypothetical protein OJ998_07180 [Solirubrobacter taibaiensis]|nr:hypothetical protein [Solirubrobacter taibaiensis]
MQERTFSLRAIAALIWAAALVIAAPSSDVPASAALLISAYPLIDAVSSFIAARWVNGAISTLAAAALAVATFGGDAGATLIVFGAWAVISGAIQFRGARGWPMRVSGGLSVLAGLSFVAAHDEPRLSMLAGYAAVGAVLYFVATYRSRHAHAGGDRGRRARRADARPAA